MQSSIIKKISNKNVELNKKFPYIQYLCDTLHNLFLGIEQNND